MTFVCNILNEEITDNIKENFDFCTMVFFLSSFIRKDLEIVLKKIDKLSKKGHFSFILKQIISLIFNIFK